MCVMLYEMITGELPFKKTNYNALIQSIVNDDPKPATELGTCDRELWRVISRGLEKSLEDRWGSMTELGEALALWLYEHGVKEDICGNSVRALWLDGALSGVRPEVPTDAPPRGSSTSRHRSDIPTQDAGVSSLARATARVRLSLRRVARRPAPLVLAAVGLVAGIVVTLMVTSRASSSERAPDGVMVAEPTKALLVAPRVAPPPSVTVTTPRALSAPETQAAEPGAERPAAPEPTRRAVGSARVQPKAIKNFGF